MAKRSQVPPKSFEDALAELEKILSDIEGGEVPLEESLVKYERGQFLIQHCRGVLSKAEKQIETLGKESSSDAAAAPAMPMTPVDSPDESDGAEDAE